MHKNGSIVVSKVRNLEVGDKFAMGFLNGIISGQVTAFVHTPYDLTDEQREYMKSKQMEIPEGDLEFIAGHGSVLIFGDFVDTNDYKFKHMFVSFGQMIAAFPKDS